MQDIDQITGRLDAPHRSISTKSLPRAFSLLSGSSVVRLFSRDVHSLACVPAAAGRPGNGDRLIILLVAVWSGRCRASHGPSNRCDFVVRSNCERIANQSCALRPALRAKAPLGHLLKSSERLAIACMRIPFAVTVQAYYADPSSLLDLLAAELDDALDVARHGCTSNEVTGAPRVRTVSRLTEVRNPELLPGPTLSMATHIADRPHGNLGNTYCCPVCPLSFGAIGSDVAEHSRGSGNAPRRMLLARNTDSIITAEARQRPYVYRRSERSDTHDEYTGAQLLSEIRRAVRVDGFELYSQAIDPLVSGTPLRCEVLLRLRGRRGSLIGADALVPLAEHHQLIHEIDALTLAKSLELLSRFHGSIAAGTRVCVNISVQTLMRSSSVLILLSLCRDAPLASARLCIELTEYAPAASLERLQDVMRSFIALGVTFALDDFGTGYASFAHLKSLPLTMLKIDGAFIRDGLHQPKAAAMISTIVTLAKRLGMETTAEYVHSETLRDQVSALGVDYAQGYAIGRPQPLHLGLQELLLKSGREPSVLARGALMAF